MTAFTARDGEALNLPPELITGEAVALELRTASFASRALAYALDLLVLFSLLVVGFFLVSLFFPGADPAAFSALSLTTMVGVLVGVPVAVETLTRGRSVGKIAAGLRVVRDDGGAIRFRQALVRGVLGFVELLLCMGAVALVASLSNARGKRIGDLLAGTHVVRQRTAALSPPPVMPAGLEIWAAGTDLGRIPDPLATAIRQFLGRAHQLHPESRQRLGTELSALLSQYVAPAPPAGVWSEHFLAAVLVERRNRDLARLLQEQQRQAERLARRRAASPLSPGSTRLIGER
ncbi:MAG: hypothetical protein QG608_3258 [Actinomycetota bacterium]|nr:hypothetical protein [Actinomycetota bacterium]